VYVHGGEPPEGAKLEKPVGSKMPLFSLNGVKKNPSRKKGSGVSTRRGRGGSSIRGSLAAYGQVRKPSMRRICFNFQKGRCTKGSTCRYMHMYEGAVATPQQELQPSTITRAHPYTAAVQLQPYQQIVTQPQIATVNNEVLPAGWSAQYDPQHQINYYYNLYTGKSQWEAPTSPALPCTIPENPAAMANVVKVGIQTQQGVIQKPMYVQAGQNTLFARVIAQHAVGQPNLAAVRQSQYPE